MTTQEFLDRYDSVSECFTERELEDLWWDDLLDVNISVVAPEEYGEPGRWTTLVSKVIQLGNRYFMIYRERGNTEYQETTYPYQPVEVRPVEKLITVWEVIKNGN